MHVHSCSSPSLMEVTVSKSAFSVYCDDGLMARSLSIFFIVLILLS
jgi:hypothetical protein